MNGTKYADAVGAIRALENFLLSKNDIEQLINAKNKAEMSSVLSSKANKGAETEELSDVWELINEYAPDCKELRILLYKNDFHNLKAVLKAIISNRDPQQYFLRPSNVKPNDLSDAINQKEYEKLIILRSAPVDDMLEKLEPDLFKRYSETLASVVGGNIELRSEKTADLTALTEECSAFYGDAGRIAHLFDVAGKPVEIQGEPG